MNNGCLFKKYENKESMAHISVRFDLMIEVVETPTKVVCVDVLRSNGVEVVDLNLQQRFASVPQEVMTALNIVAHQYYQFDEVADDRITDEYVTDYVIQNKLDSYLVQRRRVCRQDIEDNVKRTHLRMFSQQAFTHTESCDLTQVQSIEDLHLILDKGVVGDTGGVELPEVLVVEDTVEETCYINNELSVKYLAEGNFYLNDLVFWYRSLPELQVIDHRYNLFTKRQGRQLERKTVVQMKFPLEDIKFNDTYDVADRVLEKLDYSRF
jgi:hypothetical protein